MKRNPYSILELCEEFTPKTIEFARFFEPSVQLVCETIFNQFFGPFVNKWERIYSLTRASGDFIGSGMLDVVHESLCLANVPLPRGFRAGYRNTRTTSTPPHQL